MTNQNLPLTELVKRQQKVIDVLMERIEGLDNVPASPHNIFHSMVNLQQQVHHKSRKLEDVMRQLGSTSDRLESVNLEQQRTQSSLLDTLHVMQEGFALFCEQKLSICNDQFRNVFGDICPYIRTGLDFCEYLNLIKESIWVVPGDGLVINQREIAYQLQNQRNYSLVVPLIRDRWIQMSLRHTDSGNIAILLTEISALVRQNRREKNSLIDQHTRYLKSTFEQLSVGVATFATDGRLQLYNEKFHKLLDLPLSLLANETPVENIIRFVNDHLLVPQSRLPESIRAARDQLIGAPVQMHLKNGKVLETGYYRLPDRDGYVANIRDITIETRALNTLKEVNEELESRVAERTQELKEANIKLRAAKEAAEYANISKTRFLAAASHDLLQPVNAAKLYISLLKDGDCDENASAQIQKLDRAFNNVEHLLYDILDISHLESQSTSFSVTNFEISQFLAILVGDFEAEAKSKNISLELASSHHFITSDQHYLCRIVGNLVSNALQYTPDGGRVLVTARKFGDEIEIGVHDNGIGIDPKNHTKIFDEFTRLNTNKGSRNGMGLGLSIVDQAARQLGHKVDVKSKLGQGSSFRVRVPLARDVTTPVIPSRSRKDKQTEAFNCLIFLVENDVEVLEATAELLQSWGADVIAVSSKEEAIKQYQELGEIPHIVIADYHLDNQETGIEAIQALREISAQALPAIIITANHSEALEKSGELHDFSVLKKPIHLPSLHRLIRCRERTDERAARLKGFESFK